VPDDADAPLLDAWRRFVRADVAPFTVPGHKRRAGALWPTLGELLHADVPLFAGLGTMHDAVGTLAAAEALGAKLWGADWCRYSTGGSTQANQVAALGVARPGASVLVTRTAHRSTLSGLILAGLNPVWIPADVDPGTGLPIGLRLAALDEALRDRPDAAALFCVEPSYVGTISDLPAVIHRAHAHGLPVVVDQAWAAHFGFAQGYPPHALALGADVMIVSAHKALPAFSGAAVVAARAGRVDPDRLDRAFDTLETTSPAGAVLASIDASRALLADPLGPDLLARLARLVGAARARLRAAGLSVPGPEDFAPGRFDPAKLVVQFDRTDGVAVEQRLIAAGLPVESADRDTIVAMVTLVDDESTVTRLCDAIVAAVADLPVQLRPRVPAAVWTAAVPPAAMAPRDAFFARHETVPAAAAVGRVSAELIAPYPPGIPLLAPGELITADTLDALAAAARSGLRIAYARDATLASYAVVIE
jgi:arginine decarboxylase